MTATTSQDTAISDRLDSLADADCQILPCGQRFGTGNHIAFVTDQNRIGIGSPGIDTQ